MSDLLKEAIADAKVLRETALQNAKTALEEAFTPRLKSMLSAKLREDDDFEDEEEFEDEEIPAEEISDEEDSIAEPAEDEIGDEDEVEVEPEEEFEEDEDLEAGEDETDEDELDLEAIIRELEDEVGDDDTDYEDDEEVEEDFDSDDDSDDDEEEFEVDESLFEDDDEFEGGDDMDYEDEEDEGVDEMKSKLGEYKKAVKFLTNKLHEVNLLNAKLLFTNKLFKKFSLDNNQKMRVVETFDRANTTREIKLVYSTLVESFSTKNVIKRKSINEISSSKVSSTKPKRKIITEEEQVANRFKELAGIL